MHEYSVVQALLDQVEREARAHEALAVGEVTVRIGELSGVDPELLLSAYELVREGTICAAAPLRVERMGAAWACSRCGAGLPAGQVLRCGDCGSPGRLVQGGEITLERIEMEVPDVRRVRL
jgi:hydrogenase nickel incorporation protein HypA/HybF